MLEHDEVYLAAGALVSVVIMKVAFEGIEGVSLRFGFVGRSYQTTVLFS